MFNCIKVFEPSGRLFCITATLMQAESIVHKFCPEFEELTLTCGWRMDWAYIENIGF